MKEKTKILIVDDEPINLDFFDVMLSRLGFDVERAIDGEDALEKVVSFAPDLMLLDNIMPKLSGWEVTRELKTSEEYADYSTTPIIMFSAMDDVKDKIEGFELGIEDYIIKPFNFSEVLARIRAVLRHRTLAKQVAARERRIALIESLNQSLVYFTTHLKRPIVELKGEAERLDPSDPEGLAEFLDSVRNETGEVLAALGALEDEIKELRQADKALEVGDISLSDLENKFRAHFKELREDDTSVSEVSR
jgi:DNA-binding response OmpR family regulator